MEQTYKTRILIVEDEQFIRDLYDHILTRGGYEVLTAQDGEEGLKLIIENVKSNLPIRLIILDLLMPKMNGLDVLKNLKADKNLAKIPVIILTNTGQDVTIKEAFTLGVQGYIIKSSLNPEEITAYIQKILNG